MRTWHSQNDNMTCYNTKCHGEAVIQTFFKGDVTSEDSNLTCKSANMTMMMTVAAYLKVRKHSSMLMCQSLTVLSIDADRTN